MTASAAIGSSYTLTDDGAWTWYNDPRALYSNGSVYTGWVTGAGYIQIGKYDLATHVTSTALLYDGLFFQQDDHDNPAFIQTSATTFTTFYSPHGGAGVRTQDITVNPDGTSFTLSAPLRINRSGDVTGSSGWSYANPFKLSSLNKTYLFSRGPNFNPVLRVHDDAQPYGSATSWGIATTFISNPGQRPYVKYDSNNVDRVGFAFTDGHPRNVNNNIYYSYLKDNAYWRVDGTKIKDTSAGPLVLSDMGGTGTVFDKAANPALTGGNSWIWDVATDPTGHPVVTYSTFPSNTQHQYHWARWDGNNWIDRILVKDAGPYIGDASEANYSAGIVLDHADPNIVYLSYLNAGTWNLMQFKTINNGETWSTDLITNGLGATQENIRPYVPLNRPLDQEMVLYLRGQYDFWNGSKGVGYDMGVKIWTNTPSTTALTPEPSTLALAACAFLWIGRRRRKDSATSRQV